MPDVSVLDVLLHGRSVGTLTFVPGERTIFAFDEAYIGDPARPTLSLSFKDSLGALITDIPATRTRVPPFFANLLPEGPMRDYLAERAGVNPKREFFLLWVLGRDLPGAVTIAPADGEAWPQEAQNESETRESPSARRRNALRFSLAGVQLKFSAVESASGGLTIPAQGIGGSWIVKLPSTRHDSVPEHEHATMRLAAMLGMDVPEMHLVGVDEIENLPEDMAAIEGRALAVKRFDRTADGPMHMEDFAQVFGVYPDDKYEKASYRNIAEVVAAEVGPEAVAEFIRRLVFNTLIGNADMHLKNWSLIYPDRRNALLAPAYDFVSTIHYMPDANAALKYARTRRMDELSSDELAYMAAKARLPEKLVLDTAAETVARFHEAWRTQRKNLSKALAATIERHVKTVPLARE